MKYLELTDPPAPNHELTGAQVRARLESTWTGALLRDAMRRLHAGDVVHDAYGLAYRRKTLRWQPGD